MAVDRVSGDELDETRDSRRAELPTGGDSRRAELPGQGQRQADAGGGGGGGVRPEIGETRTPAEYYLALRAAVDQLQRDFDKARQSAADVAVRSAWDGADATTRPPLDGLRVPAERATHILDGDGTGGGHRHGTGSPGKSEFPGHWDDDTILSAVLSVARSPESVHRQWNQRWKALGEFDDVLISVIIEPDGTIWTAWPEEGPGVVRNPKAGGRESQ